MLATLTLLAAGSASPRERLLSLDTHFGSERSPFATLGLAAEFTPTRTLGVQLGVGLSAGLRVGSMVRARVGWERVTFQAGLGLSYGGVVANDGCDLNGAFQWPSCPDTPFGSQAAKPALLTHAEIALDVRTGVGFHAHLAYGLGMPMTGRWECSQPPCGKTPARIAPFLALSFGYVLPLYW